MVTGHRPSRIKGSEEKITNWFKHLYDRHNFLSPEFIEEYNGPDKESEHKN